MTNLGILLFYVEKTYQFDGLLIVVSVQLFQIRLMILIFRHVDLVFLQAAEVVHAIYFAISRIEFDLFYQI